MHNCKCNDERCLFRADDGTLGASMQLVTEETREGKGLWHRCSHCGLVINRTGIAADQVENFYNRAYQENNSFCQGKKINARQHFEIRLASIKNRAEYLLPRINPDARVFELGAGSGELLYLLKPYVGCCVANELCREFVDFMNTDLGIQASSENYLQTTITDRWDLAISIATLDHLNNPRDFLEKLFSDIKSGGLLYVEVPNDRQALKNHLPGENSGAFKRYMYQAAHYYSFSFDTLAELLMQTGFVIEESFSRHDYSLMNYLSWILTGRPQKSIGEAKSNSRIFPGNTAFENEMNVLLAESDQSFHEIINRHRLGESVCMLARKP